MVGGFGTSLKLDSWGVIVNGEMLVKCPRNTAPYMHAKM